MALLVHWLSQADRVGLQKGNDSFPRLAVRWLQQLDAHLQSAAPNAQASWALALKFFDYLEANAGAYLEAPEFLCGKKRPGTKGSPDAFSDDFAFDEDWDEENLFQAAYEDVVYHDTSQDGIDGTVQPEGAPAESTELLEESQRLGVHLSFLSALAQMWMTAALSPRLRDELNREVQAADRDSEAGRPVGGDAGGEGAGRVMAAMESWAARAAENRHGLLRLMQQVAEFQIARTTADHEAMTQYDRQRLIKESLLEQIINTAVETANARRFLLANLVHCGELCPVAASEINSLPEDDAIAITILGDLLNDRHDRIESLFPRLISALRSKKLLYIPLARGGDAGMIYSVRLRRRMLSHLLQWLPRQGFFYLASQLIETARFMEHHNPIGPGAVTEFDDLFHQCFHAMVNAVVQNAVNWKLREAGCGPSAGAQRAGQHASDADTSSRSSEEREAARSGQSGLPAIDIDQRDGESLGVWEPHSDDLISLLEQLTEVMLVSWLSHSRTLRLSVLETVDSQRAWQQVVRFIKRFGGPLFTQSFLQLGNVRAILHQGVGHWLDQVAEEGRDEEVAPLLEAIEAGEISRTEAEKTLGVLLEAFIDHYAEYRDYNSTTTQSDRGEYFYMLLDFLRLRVRYDRVSWNLKPIYWTHEVLVRAGCHQTAQQWRRALADRIGRESEWYIEQLQELQSRYAMRMPTVADRLHERFTHPMTVDRMRALVGPAMREFRETGHSDTFDLLIEECQLMMEQPTGVGLEIPDWLAALEEEVETAIEDHRGFRTQPRYEHAVEFRPLTMEEVRGQLDAAMQKIKSPKLGDK